MVRIKECMGHTARNVCTEHVAMCPDKLLPSLERESSMVSHWWHSFQYYLYPRVPRLSSRSVLIRPATEGGEPDLLPLLAFSSNFLFLSSSSLLSSLSLILPCDLQGLGGFCCSLFFFFLFVISHKLSNILPAVIVTSPFSLPPVGGQLAQFWPVRIRSPRTCGERVVTPVLLSFPFLSPPSLLLPLHLPIFIFSLSPSLSLSLHPF